MAVVWLSVNVYALLVGWGEGGESFFVSPSRMGLVILWWVGGVLTVLLTGSVSEPSGVADSPIFGRLKIAVFGASWAVFLVVLSRMDRQSRFVFAETGEAIRVLGLIVFAVGGIVRLLAIRTRETHARREQLAVTGVYTYIRHPEYLGILLLLLGLSSVFRSGTGLCVLLMWTGVITLRIAREETRLSNTDPDYTAYKTKTARLLPSVY